MYRDVYKSSVQSAIKLQSCDHKVIIIIALLEIFNGQKFQAFVDFDISSKIKTPKIGFNLIFIGKRACTSNIYS